MKLENYMTLKDIENEFGVKTRTVQAYILRGQVIPEDKKIKIGRQWFIDKAFAKGKWGNNEENN